MKTSPDALAPKAFNKLETAIEEVTRTMDCDLPHLQRAGKEHRKHFLGPGMSWQALHASICFAEIDVLQRPIVGGLAMTRWLHSARSGSTKNIALYAAAMLLAPGIAVAAPQPSPSAAEAICPGTPVPVVTATGGSAPYLELELAGQRGLFLIDYGASQSVIEDGVWQLPPRSDPRWTRMTSPTGATIDLISMGPNTIPGWATVSTLNFQVEDRNLSVPGHGDQIGVLGVGDLLFNQSVEFHYEANGDRRAIISAFGADCPVARLNAAGLRRIGQQGHWQQGTQAPDGIHNGPVVYVSFAGADRTATPVAIRAFAQVDTGLDDIAWQRTVIVNRPLLDRLKALSTPPVLSGSSEIIDCTGQRQRQEVYTMPGHVIRIEDERGEVVRRVAQFHLIFQAAAPACHGISVYPQPAAQIGASFLQEFETTVFLGQRNEVWVRPERAAPPRPRAF